VVTQVTALIEAHCDVFAAVLKEEVFGQTISSLQELALVTAIIAQSGVGKWERVCVYMHVCTRVFVCMRAFVCACVTVSH